MFKQKKKNLIQLFFVGNYNGATPFNQHVILSNT